MNRLSALLLAAAVCAGCDPRPGAASGIDAAAQQARALQPFYAALADLQAGRRDRVAVLQLGDSHTANDAFSGRLRELMQARFGNAGRGMLPPAIPYQYYRPDQVHVTAEGWTPTRSSPDSSGPFGLAGLQQRAASTTPSAVMTIDAEPPGLATMQIDALAQPGGGTLDVTADDRPLSSLSTRADRPALLPLRLSPGAQASSVRVQARGDGPVTLLSWRAERPQSGLTWSNLGTIGATADLLLHWDPALMRAEAATLHPDLVILAFGTNEGFRDATDLAAYPAQFAAVLHRLHNTAPHAAILVAGPPGGVRATPNATDCAADGRPGWAIPANLPRIRAIQHQLATRHGLFFWDWAAAMGGDCAILPWAETDPPLAAHDHVHLLKPGYQRTAEALFATLMDGYDQVRRPR